MRGSINAAGGEAIGGALGLSSVSLEALGGSSIVDYSVQSGPNGELNMLNFSENGVLDAGSYRLRLSADSFIDTNVPPSRDAQASFKGMFRIASVLKPIQIPEPSACSLIVMMLTTMAVRCSSRRTRKSG